MVSSQRLSFLESGFNLKVTLPPDRVGNKIGGKISGSADRFIRASGLHAPVGLRIEKMDLFRLDMNIDDIADGDVFADL